jgi:hypothetical protein
MGILPKHHTNQLELLESAVIAVVILHVASSLLFLAGPSFEGALTVAQEDSDRVKMSPHPMD